MGPSRGPWQVLQANPLIFLAMSGASIPLATKWLAQGLDLLISGGFPQEPGFFPRFNGVFPQFRRPDPPPVQGLWGLGWVV
jgi:hypothetical protein